MSLEAGEWKKEVMKGIEKKIDLLFTLHLTSS
jgi:hypothetical protein